jgi:glycosyltransferase involved in cell wall biosynthesis
MSAVRAHAPFVSVVIPCHDGERYLADAVRSVLAQRHDPIEVLVVDDGSTDGSAAVARSFGDDVRLLHQPPSGAAAARNLGVAHAHGELLAFLDADDLWPEGRLAPMIAVLDSDPGIALVFGHTEQFVSPELPEAARMRFAFDPAPAAARLSGSLIVRRAEFDRVGPMRTDLNTGEFVDWYARAEAVGLGTRIIPEVVLRRRLHPASHGIVAAADRRDYLRVVKAALDRRRERAERSE